MTAEEKIKKIRQMIIDERAKLKKKLPLSFTGTMELAFLDKLSKIIKEKPEEQQDEAEDIATPF